MSQKRPGRAIINIGIYMERLGGKCMLAVFDRSHAHVGTKTSVREESPAGKNLNAVKVGTS